SGFVRAVALRTVGVRVVPKAPSEAITLLEHILIVTIPNHIQMVGGILASKVIRDRAFSINQRIRPELVEGVWNQNTASRRIKDRPVKTGIFWQWRQRFTKFQNERLQIHVRDSYRTPPNVLHPKIDRDLRSIDDVSVGVLFNAHAG